MNVQKHKWKLLIWLSGINLFISTFTFGGGYVVVPMVRKYFVEHRKLFSEEKLMSMAAVAQSSPGAIAVNLSALAGLHTAGTAGLIISVISSVIPPLVVLSVISYWYTAFSQSAVVSAVLLGMQAGAAAVIVDFIVDMVDMITKERSRLLTALIPAVFAASFFFHIHAAILLLISSALCLIKIRFKIPEGEII